MRYEHAALHRTHAVGFQRVHLVSSGYIDLEQLHRFMHNLGRDLGNDELTTLFKQINVSCNGRISFEEFRNGLEYLAKEIHWKFEDHQRVMLNELSNAAKAWDLLNAQIEILENLFLSRDIASFEELIRTYNGRFSGDTIHHGNEDLAGNLGAEGK